MHGISNMKLLHTHSFIYHCHSLPALLNYTLKLWRRVTNCMTGISSAAQFRMTSLVQALRISHLSSRYCDSCARAYNMRSPGTATPAQVHITSLAQALRLLHINGCGTNFPWQMTTSLPNRHFPSLRGQVYK